MRHHRPHRVVLPFLIQTVRLPSSRKLKQKLVEVERKFFQIRHCRFARSESNSVYRHVPDLLDRRKVPVETQTNHIKLDFALIDTVGDLLDRHLCPTDMGRIVDERKYENAFWHEQTVL